MISFQKLAKKSKNPPANGKTLELAILGDTATQFLSQAIEGHGTEFNFDINVWEADYNQIQRQVLDPVSELYDQSSDIIILFKSSHKLLSRFNKTEINRQKEFAQIEFEELKNLFEAIKDNSPAKILIYNFNEIDDNVFGNLGASLEASFLFQLRKLNFLLSEYVIKSPNLYLIDLSSIQNTLGRDALFQASIYANTDMVFSLNVLPHISHKTVSLIASLYGKSKKCLILDLDNTLWGGVIGDDGIENIQLGDLGVGKCFTEFQHWVKKLKNRGIVLAICSKNNESIAKEPFEKHPDMVLRLDDISLFVANWENKADNIRYIQETLNIGFESMVFLDDNPVERQIVRENLQEVTVPDLPTDPADYLEFLYKLNLFDTISHSEEDGFRTKFYRVEARRKEENKKFTNVNEFLESLEMKSSVETFNTFNIPRVAQLSQRSNQFNLRTVRYDQHKIQEISENQDYLTLAFTLEDKFGDNGLISFVILNPLDKSSLFIDSWIMSCRVLKRSMEAFVLNNMIENSEAMGYERLVGEYLPTAKNELVKNHYSELGFSKLSEYRYELLIRPYQPRTTFIEKITN